METNTFDWTHKKVKITDIRKLNKLYVLTIQGLSQPLFIKFNIFDARIKSYFLKDAYKVTRDEILSVEWNLYLTRGHYVKIDEKGTLNKFEQDKNKWYVSFLEIDGELSSFSSIYRDRDKDTN